MWMPLAMTLLAGLSTGLGGLIPLFLPASDRLMAASMGFAGGVMLTVSLADLLPGALGWYRQALPPLPAALALVSLLCMGMGLAALMGRLLPPASAPAGGRADSRAAALRGAMAAGLALVLHNLPEGLLTLFSGVADPRLGLRMALAIALHNLPEGVAVAAPLYCATGKRARSALAALASGLAEPVGAVVAFGLLYGRLTPGFLNGLLVLVAGIMCWVSAAELIPGGLAVGRGAAVGGFAGGICLMLAGIACLG